MNLDNFEELKGGLNVAVVGRHNSPPDERTLLDHALLTILDREAQAHHSDQTSDLRNARLIKALDAGKIEAWFMVAAWDVNNPKILGAAIELPTILINEVDGKLTLSHAKYREDTCFLNDVFREIIKEKPSNKSFPEVGLADYFEQERNRVMISKDPTGKVQGGRVGEYSPHSSQMIKVMSNMGASLGRTLEPIMELKGGTPLSHKYWPVTVDTIHLNDEVTNKPLDYVFATSWQSRDGKQQIMATFTEAISTFTGEPIIRVQFGTLENMPEATLVKDITASLLVAGRAEAERRNWKQDEAVNSPIGSLEPTMRIHAPSNLVIVEALKDIDAQVRSLGHHPMLPVTLSFSDMKNKMGLTKNPDRPMSVIDLSQRSNAPAFDFAT